MKSLHIFTLAVLLLAVSSQTDNNYLFDLDIFFAGLGSAAQVNTTGISACFDNETAVYYLESLGLVYDLVFTYANGEYQYLQWISDTLSNLTANLTDAYECIENDPNGEALNLAIFGTNNQVIINAIQQTFIFSHTQDYLDLQSNVFDQIQQNNWYLAGVFAFEVGVTSRIIVNEVGIARELFNIQNDGGLFYFNLTVPSQSLLCADEVQAQLSLDNLAEFANIVGNSDAQSLIANIQTFEIENVGLIDVLYPVSACASFLPEAKAYSDALGYDVYSQNWGTAVWDYINEEPEVTIELFGAVADLLNQQSYFGAGYVLSAFNEIVAISLSENSKKN